MTFGQSVLIAALSAAGVYGLWTSHERHVAERDLLAYQDVNGFVPITTPPGTTPDSVIILAALNCPSAAAQRAETMSKRLTEMGIPNTRANHYAASINDRDQLPLLKRTSIVLGGEIPIVIVNGRAKANPTVDEVASEFRLGN